MIEINMVKEKYASMPDSELISFAKEEGHHLTAEGLQLLKTEFINRKLEQGFIDNIEGYNVSLQEEDTKKTDQNDHFTRSYWSYAFDQKEYGKNNGEIINGLMERGLEEPQAVQLVSKLETIAKQRLKKAELEKLTGSLIFISGIAITFLPLSITSNRLPYIIAWCVILFGASKYIKGLYYKTMFKKIITNIAIDSSN